MKFNFKLYKLFLLLFLVFSCVHCQHDIFKKLSKEALSCERLKEIIVCEKLDNCTDGIIVPRASHCNFCDMCIKYLEKDELCEEITDASFKNVILRKCKEGLKCYKGKCIFDDSNANSCLKQRDLRNEKRDYDDFSLNLWIPKCDYQGNYRASQDKNGNHICFDEYGNRLFGRGKDSIEDTCACSRFMQQKRNESPLEYNILPLEHCSKHGSFDSVQCINDLCYCADEATGEVKSHLVRRDYIDRLSCGNEDKSIKKYLKPCEEELQRHRHLAYELSLKGVELRGADRVECDPDGSFAPKQRENHEYVCSDERGVSIGSYAINVEEMDKLQQREKPIYMTCNCAREQAHTTYGSECKAYGNYAFSQCLHGDGCYCVDDDGAVISKKFDKSPDSETFCENLLNSLYTINDVSRTTFSETEETDYYYDF